MTRRTRNTPVKILQRPPSGSQMEDLGLQSRAARERPLRVTHLFGAHQSLNPPQRISQSLNHSIAQLRHHFFFLLISAKRFSSESRKNAIQRSYCSMEAIKWGRPWNATPRSVRFE